MNYICFRVFDSSNLTDIKLKSTVRWVLFPMILMLSQNAVHSTSPCLVGTIITPVGGWAISNLLGIQGVRSCLWLAAWRDLVGWEPPFPILLSNIPPSCNGEAISRVYQGFCFTWQHALHYVWSKMQLLVQSLDDKDWCLYYLYFTDWAFQWGLCSASQSQVGWSSELSVLHECLPPNESSCCGWEFQWATSCLQMKDVVVKLMT